MYWLLKSEPSAWSWDDQIRERTTKWDGVRNYQARNNMRSMHLNDLCFFYHSAIKEPAIMGIVKVIKMYESALDEPQFGYVTVEAVEALTHPVTLKSIKNEPLLSNLGLIRQSRLSVMPVSDREWKTILKMSHG